MGERERQAWAEAHFGCADLGDVRRTRRAVTIAERMLEAPGTSIPGLFERRYDVKAAYTFFSHPRSTPDRLQEGHRIQLQERLASGRTILLAEDTSTFSWSGKAPCTGMGPIGVRKQGLQGFFVHSVLALEWQDEAAPGLGMPRPPVRVLGVADQQYYARSPQRKRSTEAGSQASKQRQRESEVWSYATLRLGEAPEGARWIRVCDREADIYEFLSLCQEWKHGFVVRATQDRALVQAEGPARLFSHLRALPETGSFRLSLRGRPGRAARDVVLRVAFSEVLLRAPQRPGKNCGYLPGIDCTAVRVWEAEPPEGEGALEWMLLTDRPVTTAEEAIRCARWYSCRWLTEEFHKVLKTGLGAERLQMESVERIYAAIALMSVIAARILDLKEAARLDPFGPAEASGLSAKERHLLALRLKRKLTTVRDVILALGRLGGHMGAHQGTRVDQMPGWLTLWRGMQALTLMVQGADLAATAESFGV